MTAYDPELRNTFDNANPQWQLIGESLQLGTTDIGLYGLRIKADPDTVLVYYQKEWDAFVAGVQDGEFDLDRLTNISGEVGVRPDSGLPRRQTAADPR